MTRGEHVAGQVAASARHRDSDPFIPLNICVKLDIELPHKKLRLPRELGVAGPVATIRDRGMHLRAGSRIGGAA